MKKLLFPGLLIAAIILLGGMYLILKPSPKSHKAQAVSVTRIKAPTIHPNRAISKEIPAESIPSAPIPNEQNKLIQDIQGELQAVMDLNQKINQVQTSKSAQLLRIQEQASIHQKILAEIQKTADAKKIKTPSRDVLLAQEKLRIIREETLRSKKILEDPATQAAS